MGTDNTFETLALVVPDNKYNARAPLVIGTNLAVRCKESCESLQGLMFLQTTKLPSVWRRAYKSLKYLKRVLGEGSSDRIQIRNASRHPIKIGSHQTVCVCVGGGVPGLPIKTVLDSVRRSQGLTVTPSLITLSPKGTKCRVPVEITNNSPQPLTLSARKVIATTHLAQEVMGRLGEKQGQKCLGDEQTADVGVNLTDATLTTEQKEDVRKMLAVCRMFSQEMGKTMAVPMRLDMKSN